MTATKCCVRNCKMTRADNVILHIFPEPESETERFNTWLEATDGEISELSREFIFKNRRICHVHFENKYFTWSKRLSPNAIPTLNLPRPSNVNSRSPENDQLSETVDADDPGFELPSSEDVISGLKTANVNTLIQLRLISNSVLDEPIYEVLTDDQAYHKLKTTAQKPENYLQGTDISSNGNKVTEEHELTEEKFIPNTKLHGAVIERNNDMSLWKIKLLHILHNPHFCGICLDADVEMNDINDEFEIIDEETIYRKTLKDIMNKVFNETEILACNNICDNCTKKLIQSYIFIHSTEEKLKMLTHYLNELYNKTCYIGDNVLKDSHSVKSKIHNVVIVLDNKDIAKILGDGGANVEKMPAPKTEGRRRRMLKCASCNIILPSYRAWKVHERTAHRQKHRCRICLQSYRTQQDLTAHYKTHLKSRCAVCHRTVRDGRLLQHLRERHRHAVHLCPTCNVALYSSRALERHVSEWHGRGGSKCVTCLRSLSQVELESHRCRFQCPECVEVPCVHHEYLMSYREQMLNLSFRAKCVNCRYVCTSKQALIAHVNREHLGLQPHNRDSSGRKIYRKSDLNTDKLPCSFCDRVFLNDLKMKKHMLQTHNRAKKRTAQSFDCLECQARVITKAALVFHQISHRADRTHSSDSQPRVSLRQLKIHKIKHKHLFSVCEVCGKRISRNLFRKHLSTHYF